LHHNEIKKSNIEMFDWKKIAEKFYDVLKTV